MPLKPFVYTLFVVLAALVVEAHDKVRFMLHAPRIGQFSGIVSSANPKSLPINRAILKGGGVIGEYISLWQAMMRWWHNEPWFWHMKQSGLREGMCVICVMRARHALATQMSRTPLPSPPPPVEKCPIQGDFFLPPVVVLCREILGEVWRQLCGMLTNFWNNKMNQPNGPAEVRCEYIFPDLWVEFWNVNREWIFLSVNFSGGLFWWKNRIKKLDPRIRVQNSGVQNLFPRIRPQIRVSEVQNPLCRHLFLKMKA